MEIRKETQMETKKANMNMEQLFRWIYKFEIVQVKFNFVVGFRKLSNSINRF